MLYARLTYLLTVLAVAGTVLVTSGKAVNAQVADVATVTTNACLNANPNDQKQFLSKLKGIGWKAVNAPDLSDENILAISAIKLTEQLGYGSVSAVRWKSTWELITKNAAGTRNLILDQSATNWSTWFAYPENPSLVAVHFTSRPKFGQIYCMSVFHPDLATTSLGPAASAAIAAGQPPILRMRGRKFGDKSWGQTLNMTFLNAPKISELTETDFQFIAVATVLNSRAN